MSKNTETPATEEKAVQAEQFQGMPAHRVANANSESGKKAPKSEKMTAAEAQQAWQSLRVQDGGSNSGNSVLVNDVEVIQVLRGYNGVTFVPVSGGQAETFVLDPSEQVTVKMPPRGDLNVENANGELED